MRIFAVRSSRVNELVVVVVIGVLGASTAEVIQRPFNELVKVKLGHPQKSSTNRHALRDKYISIQLPAFAHLYGRNKTHQRIFPVLVYFLCLHIFPLELKSKVLAQLSIFTRAS